MRKRKVSQKIYGKNNTGDFFIKSREEPIQRLP